MGASTLKYRTAITEDRIGKPMKLSPAAGRFPWPLVVTASLILLITMGARQTIGLFIAPLDSATGLGIVSISLAVAIAQFVWGVAQPVFGAVADRYGPGRVIAFGGAMLAIGTAATPFVRSEWALIAPLGLVSAFGAGAGSLAILIGSGMQPPAAPLRDAPARRRLGTLDRGAAGRRTADLAPAAARGRRRAQLLVSASRLLHLRLSCRVPGDAFAGRGAAVRPVADDRRQFAGNHRSRQRGRQPGGRLARHALPAENSAVRDLSRPRRPGP